MADTLDGTHTAAGNFAAWVAVLDSYAANLDAIVSGELGARRHVSTEGLGPLPRSLETRATDLLTRTRAYERQVEDRMHEVRQREQLATRMKRNSTPARRSLLDAGA